MFRVVCFRALADWRSCRRATIHHTPRDKTVLTPTMALREKCEFGGRNVFINDFEML